MPSRRDYRSPELLRSDDTLTTSLFHRLGIEPRGTREQILSDLRDAA